MRNFFSRVTGVFSENIGVDLGTSNIRICNEKDILVNEPTVIALDEKDNKIIAKGRRAKCMSGRTPADIRVLSPLAKGKIEKFDSATKMLAEFIKETRKGGKITSPTVVVAVPHKLENLERDAFAEAIKSAGAREAYIIDSPMAAALGIGIDIFQPEGHMIVDIGGGATKIAVVALGGIAVGSISRDISGTRFDESIRDYIDREDGLRIGLEAAEEVKIQIGAVLDSNSNAYISSIGNSQDSDDNFIGDTVFVEVNGQNKKTNLPNSKAIYSNEIVLALDKHMDSLVTNIKDTFEKLRPELTSDINKKGIYLIGGGALLRGIDKRIYDSIGRLKVTVCDNPETAVIRGVQVVLQNLHDPRYRQLLSKKDSEDF